MQLRAALLATLTATLAWLGLTPTQAKACGGFACNNAQPVNQSAERIIFAHEADGSVTAVIQIQYEGPSESFAWMIPVAGSPEVGVSSDDAFTRIQQVSNPQYRLTTTVEGTCSDGSVTRGGPVFDSAGSADMGAAAADGGAVTVVDSGSVGPYDYVIINVDPTTPDVVDAAIEWLQSSDYDVPAMGADVLRPYLESGMNLLAFRLTKGNDAGSIRPVRLSFGPGLPSIPIRPTAISTQPDLGIMVWVLGEERAVPANYRSLELNEALINWLNPGSTYDAVVTRAANEADGQGFVTELAGPSAPLADAIWLDWEANQWANIQGQDWTGREGQLLRDASNFLFLDGMRSVLETHLPIPTGVDPDLFFSCINCYYGWNEADIDGFDPVAFLADVAANVIDPIVETQALFEANPYVTRLYTTMSADEMTVDPIFDFNPDLGDVSNQHNADRIIECSPSVSRFEAPWRIELENGQVIRGSGTSWPFATDSSAMPANERIVRVGNEGEGEPVVDNTDSISAALEAHNATVAGPPSSRDGGLCSVSPSGGRGAAGFALALLAGLCFTVRRRR